MANLLGTTVNGALSASGRISVTYDTDRYQFNFLRASGSNWWVTNDTGNLGLHLNNVGDKFYFSTGGDFYSDTNGWLSTALAGKLSLSGGTMSGDIIFPDNSSAGLRNAAANAGFRLDDQYGNMYSYNFGGGYYVDATSYYFRSSASSNWMTISGGTVQASGDFRAPIFYDSNDTAYYLDPNSTSRLQSLWLRGAGQYDGELYIGGTSAGSALRINYDQIWTPNGNLHLMYSGAGNIDMNYGGGYAFSRTSLRAPIFYDYNDTTYYFDGNSTTSLRTKGSWRADSADWDGEYSGKIQYHANHWYFQAGNFWFFRNAGGANVVSINQGGNISVSGYVGDNSGQTRDKLRVWDGSAYTIGMKSGYNYGHLGTDQYAMSFQMNNENGRGFWWGDNAHSDNEGAASLTTDGRMVIAKSLSIGEGESILSPSSTPLYVKGTTSGADVVGVDGINGRLFTVTDDLSGSLFSVNTIAGLPVIEAFADNTVTIGKYGYATTWSTTGFMTVPNSANIYRDLFINGGRGGNFGNRLIIGTDAATYTLNDGNQRPVAYLHGQYPVLTLNHTVTSNTAHGPTIQFTHHTNDKQWVIGSNGTGTRLDIGYSTNTDRNPHNGIDDYNGSTFIRVDNGGNVQLGRGNGRSTWVNDTLYVGASDSGDSHMYFGEDSSNWYGLHWYWDSGYTVYLYGRNAGTDTEIMRYTTNSNAYVEWRRHFNMNNYEINYVSQLHFNNNTRFVNATANYLYFQLGSDSYGSLQVRDNSNNLKGYLGYFDSSGFGLLNSSGNWGIRFDPGNAGSDIFYAGAVKLKTLSNGARVYGDLFLDDNYGNTIVGAYDSYRYQGIFAMGNAYKLAADGQGTGNLYGLAWTHTNVGGQSKAGLEHQLLVMNYGTTLTALGNGIWTSGLITTTSYGTSANWNTAYGWGNHASAGYIVQGTQILSSASWTTATRFGSVGDISQAAGNHALSVRSEDGNDAFMSFHIGGDYAVHFGLERTSNRMYVGGWSDGTGNKYQIWDSRDFSSTNISNWNTAYGWGNHAGLYQPLENQRLSTNHAPTFANVYTAGWFRNYGNQGIYNQDYGTHFYSNGGGNWVITGSGGSVELQFRSNHQSTLRGWVYANTSNEIGFLSEDGNWVLRTWNRGVEAYGSMRAPIFYDSADTSYYVDPNSYSRLWRTSTHLGPSPGVGSSNWVTDFNNTPVSSMSFGGDLSAGGPQGTWWFQQNMRHSNSSNYWGTQIAWGWEDNANELWQRNVTGGSWSSWVRYINTNNYAGILDARYYTETEVNNLLSSYATTSSLSGYVATTYNTSLNSDSRNTRGVTRLYRRDDNSDFSVQTHWTGTYWRLEGYNGDTYHAGVSVAHAGLADSATNANYANSAGSASNADTVDGFHASVAGTANTIPTRNSSGYLIPENWIQLNGIYGLYAPTNNAHLRPNPNSYGSWLVTGGRNSWGGIEFDYGSNGPITMMIASDSNTVGFHNNSYGWQIRWANGTLYVGKNSYGGGDVAVIDANSIGSQSVNYANYSGYSNGLSRYGIIYGNNWNSYNVNGQFIVMSAHGHSGSNRPSGAYTYGSGMSYYNSGSDHYQFYIPENSGNSNGNSQKIWYRSGWNDNWGGWRSIVDLYNSVCYIDGTVTASGDVIAYSDARVKENVHTIENALDKTLKLRGVTYNRTDVEDKSTKIGVIAQEIMEVLPEVVSEDETGMYGVSYGNLTAVLIEAIKEQQKQIEELRNELNKLKG